MSLKTLNKKEGGGGVSENRIFIIILVVVLLAALIFYGLESVKEARRRPAKSPNTREPPAAEAVGEDFKGEVDRIGWD
ncbi:MAG: hypothetical protein GF416_04690 [Candidatus Altiarchaeales archaeon]|nr:hypothetical protein [Candidatus Altiarchaeales archaeon]MBD3416418.1 hypothetical protein [Candidatus Altiarchaeales archaeon]